MVSVSIPAAFADELTKTTRFRDYQVEEFSEGTVRQTIGMVPYVWNGNNFVDRVIQNNVTHFNVYSEMGSFSFNKSSCTITQYTQGFDPTVQTAHGSDVMIGDWFWTIARKNGTNPWEVIDPLIFGCSINTFQNSTGKYLEMTRTHNPTGSYLKVTIAAPEGKNVEDFNEFYMNVPAWSGNKFAFVLWAKDVKTDSLTYKNNTVITIPQGQTIIDRSQLTISSLNFVKDGNAFFFDWKKAQAEFKTLILNKTGTNLDVQFGFNNNATTLSSGGKMFLDPTYGYTAGTIYRILSDAVASATCDAPFVKDTPAVSLYIRRASSAAADQCAVTIPRWDISTIPAGQNIQTATLKFDVDTATNMGGIVCEINPVTNDPSTAAAATLWTDANDGTAYATDTQCQVVSTNYVISLGGSATSDISAAVPGGIWQLGMTFTTMARDGTLRFDGDSTVGHATELQINYTAIGPPNAVTTLTVDDFDTTTVDLSLTQPALNGGTLQRYMFNYTTPCSSNPLTALPNGTTALTYTVSGLTADTCYTFRATAATQGGKNVTGANEVNVTTLAFNQANFTIGSFNFNANNPDIFPIRYERIDLNTTHTLVNITFNNAISLACDLRYTYAGTNHTYHTIPSAAISASEDESSFQFINATNEITTFHCWNQIGNQSANYVLTQTDFLLLQQIDDFRNGTYGTMGQFGAFDLITLIIVIIAMIGLNGKSENVGGFFCIVAISVMAFFGIIAWATAIIAGLAVIIMLAIAATRKD